jgi:hypothetical protein
MDFEQQINQVNHTLEVVIEIQRRQAEVQKLQAELVNEMREGMKRHEQRMEHIEMTLSEIGDKLNGLIGFTDNFGRRPLQ